MKPLASTLLVLLSVLLLVSSAVADDKKTEGPSIQLGDPIVLGPMHPERTIEGAKDELLKCYTDVLAKSPGVYGKVVAKFFINNDGTVSSSSTKSSTMKNPLVENCLHDTIVGLEFPTHDSELVIVSFPFAFSPE